MSLWPTLRFVMRHPVNRRRPMRALARFAGWQLRARIWPRRHRVRFVNDAYLLVRKNMHGATGVAYLGIPDFEEMSFLLHYLRGGDCFVDVGANVGVYSILAAAIPGVRVHAVEPVPSAIDALDLNIEINGAGERIEVHPCALGAREGECLVTLDRDTMNQVTDEARGDRNTLAVPMHTLDCLDLGPIDVLKLDVEGFEGQVLAGAINCLERNPPKIVLIEVLDRRDKPPDGAGHDVLRSLNGLGYVAYGYDPVTRKLWADPGKRSVTNNAILVRDEKLARDRVANADPFRVLGRTY